MKKTPVFLFSWINKLQQFTGKPHQHHSQCTGGVDLHRQEQGRGESDLSLPTAIAIRPTQLLVKPQSKTSLANSASSTQHNES